MRAVLDFLTIGASAALAMLAPGLIVMGVLDWLDFNLITAYYWTVGTMVAWLLLATLYYYWFTTRDNDGATALSWYYFIAFTLAIGLLMLIGLYTAVKYVWMLV
jgi:hypothetical protein